MKQKVLFILNSLCFGGAEKHVTTLLNNLDTSKLELSLAYLKDDTTLLPQIETKRLKAAFCCNVDKKVDWMAAKKIAQFVDSNDIDIIVCVNAYPLLYGWLAHWLSKRKPRIMEIFHSTTLGTLKENIKMMCFFPLFRISDTLVYVCENQRKYWSARALGAKQISVIYNGIDVAHFIDSYTVEQKNSLRKNYAFTDNDFIVGLCAAMRPEKAHKDLLKAIANLRAEGLNAKGLLIGDGPMRTVIEKQIKNLCLEKHVKITGFMDDVRPAIAACDVMAITSHSVETFSIAALEAMALGKPMIMTDIGGAAEQISHGINGYLYTYGDIAALSHALRQLMDPSKRLEMGACARTTVTTRFSLASMTDAYNQLFAKTQLDGGSLAI